MCLVGLLCLPPHLALGDKQGLCCGEGHIAAAGLMIKTHQRLICKGGDGVQWRKRGQKATSHTPNFHPLTEAEAFRLCSHLPTKQLGT